jgi:hypothetical protein
VQEPCVPREINTPTERAYQEPVLTPEQTRQVNEVTQWSRTHDKMMYCGAFVTISKLSKFVYDVKAFRAPKRPVANPLRARIDPSAPAANNRGTTPQKDKSKAQVANQSKPKAVDKGKGKLVEPERPKKAAAFPLQIGGAFKIFEKDLIPSAPPVTQLVKRSPS